MKQQKRKIKKTIPFTMASKIIRYLGINLTKEVKDLFSENYKTLMKEIEDDTKTWKDIPCSWIRRMNIIKVSILPKTIYTFTFTAIIIKGRESVNERPNPFPDPSIRKYNKWMAILSGWVHECF